MIKLSSNVAGENTQAGIQYSFNNYVQKSLLTYGGGLLLILKIPADFLNYGWKDTAYGFDSKTVPTPEIDKVLTTFISEYKQNLFTYEFILYVNGRTLLFNKTTIDAKVNFAVDLYKKICNVPPSADEELNKIVSFYLGNKSTLNYEFDLGFVSILSTNLQNLGASLKTIENKYIELLKITLNKSGASDFKIPDQWARELINIVKARMVKNKDEFFAANMNGCVVKVEERSDKSLTEEGKQAKALLDEPKVRAFLIVVRNAEAYGRVRAGGQILQYDEAFSFKKIPNLNDHPGTLPGSSSSAAGAYQIMKDTWFGKGKDKGAKKILGLTDFSPLSQDIFAAYKLNQRGVVKKLLADDFAGAVQAASFEWASFPDKDKGDPETNPRSRYSGQAEHIPALSWLRDKYNKALGR